MSSRVPRTPEHAPGWPRVSASLRICAAIGLVAVATTAAVFRTTPTLERKLLSGPSVCVLKLTTGVPCLACRGTRAALALARGDLPAAFRFNPLATAVLLGGLTLSSLVALSGRCPPLPRPTKPWNSVAWTALGLALAANWAYVIAAGG